MKGILVLFVICALATAMVPRERRAVPSEEQPASTTSKPVPPIVCAPHTPCAWTVYNSDDIIEYNLTNNYCICDSTTVCRIYEHDTSINSLVHRCQPPEVEETTTDSS